MMMMMITVLLSICSDMAPLLPKLCTKCRHLISAHAALDLDLPHIIRNQSKVTRHKQE